jgi:hypothetical protein
MTNQEVEQYITEHPMAWVMFERFTLEAVGAGWRHVGAKMIAERIRWETMIQGKDYRFNNNYTAGFARRFMRLHPRHSGLFATRKAASDIDMVAA